MKIERTPIFLALFLALTSLTSVPAFAAGYSLNSNGGKVQHVVYVQFDNVHFYPRHS